MQINKINESHPLTCEELKFPHTCVPSLYHVDSVRKQCPHATMILSEVSSSFVTLLDFAFLHLIVNLEKKIKDVFHA